MKQPRTHISASASGYWTAQLVLSTKHVPAAERVAYWRQMVANALISTTMCSDDPDFQAEASLTDLGAVQVFVLSHSSVDVSRTPKLIRQSDPERYQISLMVRGSVLVEQAGRTAALQAGDLAILDSSKPFRGCATTNEGTLEHIVAQFPKTLFPLTEKEVARLLARTLPGHGGIGRLVSRYLRELAADQADHSPADSARLAIITIDLMTALCARELEAERSLPGETRRQALLAGIHDFIARRLADPRLSPETIAGAHQISLRYLHKLFHAEGLTVAGWVRHLRLERCRRDLADPRLRDRSINAIATRWGFGDAAHFSRLFRTTYGLPPRDYRHIAHTGNVHECPTAARRTSTT